jgi:hypothetical protein
MTSISLRLCLPVLLTNPEGNSKLKISFSKTPTEERWILHGRLAGPWVHELRTCWKVNHRTDEGRACIVDVNEVTFIDKSGERLLCMLARDGAKFNASGICTKHLIEHLNVRRKRFISNPVTGLITQRSFLRALGGAQ